MTVFHSTSAGREETLSSSVQICIFSVCQVIYESMTKEVHQSPQEPKTAAQSKLPVDRVMFIFGTFAAMHRGVVVENARTLKDTDTDTWNKYVYICICFYWSLPHHSKRGIFLPPNPRCACCLPWCLEAPIDGHLQTFPQRLSSALLEASLATESDLVSIPRGLKNGDARGSHHRPNSPTCGPFNRPE